MMSQKTNENLCHFIRGNPTTQKVIIPRLVSFLVVHTTSFQPSTASMQFHLPHLTGKWHQLQQQMAFYTPTQQTKVIRPQFRLSAKSHCNHSGCLRVLHVTMYVQEKTRICYRDVAYRSDSVCVIRHEQPRKSCFRV